MTNNIRILGIDPSLAATGVCVIDKKCDIILSTKIETKPTDKGRILYILDHLRNIVNEQKVTHAIIEGFAFGARGNAMFTLGELSGCIKLILNTMMRETMIIVPPTVLKKFATGKGNCQKDLVLLQVYKRFGIEFSTSDMADAFVLAMIGRCYFFGYADIKRLNNDQVGIINRFKKDYEDSSLF